VSGAALDLDERAAGLKAAFDGTFARSPQPLETATEDLLAIRTRGDPYALRVRELTALLVNRKIVPVPSPRPELLGVAGLRGALVPVYCLSSLLGYGANGAATRWLAVCGRTQSVGLAFDELESFLRLPRPTLHAVDRGDATRPHLGEAFRIGPATGRLIDTRSILNWLGVDTGSSGMK
jgi:chemotaxis signal transduction protein